MRLPAPAGVVIAGLLAIGALAVLLTAADVGTTAPPLLADPGALVRWAIPVLRLIVDLAMSAALGALALAVLLDAGRPYRPALLLAARAGALWSLSQAILLIMMVSRAAGVGLTDASLWPVARSLVVDTSGGLGAAIAVVASGAAAVALAMVSWGGRGWSPYLAGVLVVVGALGWAPSGHATSSAAGASALIGRAMHLLGVGAWVGGLLALVLLWPQLWRDRLAANAAHGFSLLAGGAFLLVAGSGLATGLAVVGRVDPFASPYTRLMVAKTLLLLVLGGLGAWHRLRHLPRLDRSGARGLLNLAVAELAMMAVVIAFAAVLADTPPPGSAH
ncbi:MAG: CopD family protein [Kineosporiaceae bacterium]